MLPRATVAGWTSMRASFHCGHHRRKHTQRRRSDGRKRRFERARTPSWCRRARIWRSRSVRADTTDRSTATIRNALRMAHRVTSSRAKVNDIFASFLPVREYWRRTGRRLAHVAGVSVAATLAGLTVRVSAAAAQDRTGRCRLQTLVVPRFESARAIRRGGVSPISIPDRLQGQ
jgi:hypothetical protein